MTTPKTERARRLRKDQTEAERRLWTLLRGRRMCGFKFRRQQPIDRYIADFASIEAKLVIELDGDQHAERTTYDEGRTAVLEQAGFRVLRFWNSEVFENLEGVERQIDVALKQARP